jgi:UDP-N-acetylmuramoylalanine--D-glutamate ligase
MSKVAPSRALVVGLGVSGVAAAALLASHGWQVTVNDRATESELAARLGSLPTGVALALGAHSTELLEGVTLLVVSPGVPWELPLLVEARRRGVEVIAEVELASRFLVGVPLVGVTGSNGKTTVTSLVGEILRAAGWRVGVGGNIGTAASELALAGGFDTVVLELSSFQLEGCSTLRPRVGVLLNISPDHLDRHPTVGSYLAAKVRIFAHQYPDDVAVLNADDRALAGVSVPSRTARFSLTDRTVEAHLEGDTLVLDRELLLPRSQLCLLGDHNVANALAAALAASRLGIPTEAIAAALAAFAPLPHRHQVVAEGGGVRWVDDSKGTNIGATAAGLAGYPAGTVHLILGGLGKGQNFGELRSAVEDKLARVYLIGEAAEEIAAALQGTAPIEKCGTLDEAVRRAATNTRSGDTVLLSPACASFDQFANYAHRGNEFARLARLVAEDG